MTPRRWLLLASGAALLYAGQMITAYLMGGGGVLPIQVNTVVVTTLAVGFVAANSQDLAAKVDRKVESLTADQANQIGEATELLRRLGHLEARMATKVESLNDQTAKVDQLWADFAAHLDAAASDPASSSGVDPAVRAIGERVVRRLGRDGPMRH